MLETAQPAEQSYQMINCQAFLALEKLSRQVQSGRSGWELSASDLELANEVLGQGATARVQAGRLCFGDVTVRVRSPTKILLCH